MFALHLGNAGPQVGRMHQALLESGEVVPADELAAMTFGPGTRAALKHFQAHHTDQAGRPLVIDGLVGPATSWALEHPGGAAAELPEGWAWDRAATPAAAVPVCAAAVADIGLREDPDGSNDGPALQKFRTGGAPWCALAVSTWYAAAPAGSPFGRVASCWGLHAWAKARGALVDLAAARPGDLALFLRAGGHGHVGLVVGRAAGALCTVEGNCSNAVRAMLRDPGKLQAIARPIP